jgi:hypothetical protein
MRQIPALPRLGTDTTTQTEKAPASAEAFDQFDPADCSSRFQRSSAQNFWILPQASSSRAFEVA